MPALLATFSRAIPPVARAATAVAHPWEPEQLRSFQDVKARSEQPIDFERIRRSRSYAERYVSPFIFLPTKQRDKHRQFHENIALFPTQHEMTCKIAREQV
jgi:hypothetical protein